jgi:low temperature requirement protein LtrA
MSSVLRHVRRPMSGRDPHEQHRVATPLELLFDLVFVIAFGAAADELAHAVTSDHVADGVLGFAFAVFAVTWAWINFSWFASAYDTDDWLYRVLTMVQMVGVLVLALGLPDLFESLAEGGTVDNTVMVLGYVVMRAPMIAQWLRAEREDPARRGVCRSMAATLAVAQVGWVVLVLVDLDLVPFLLCAAVLVAIELVGPVRAERVETSGRGATGSTGTPWHAHHIAERYGLLVIITLGEAVLGTAVALRAIVGPEGPGWSGDVAVLGLAGIGMTFGLWWAYFNVPWADLLHASPARSFGWGYGHLAVFGSLAAVGAGLHAAAYAIEHHTELDPTGTVLTTAVPLLVFVVAYFLLYSALTRSYHGFHAAVVAGSVAVVVVSVALVAAGVPLVWSLAVLALTPWVPVLGYETVGHRHVQESVDAPRTRG